MSEYKRLRVRLLVSTSDYKWLQVTTGETTSNWKRLRVTKSDSEWLRVTTNELVWINGSGMSIQFVKRGSYNSAMVFYVCLKAKIHLDNFCQNTSVGSFL